MKNNDELLVLSCWLSSVKKKKLPELSPASLLVPANLTAQWLACVCPRFEGYFHGPCELPLNFAPRSFIDSREYPAKPL